MGKIFTFLLLCSSTLLYSQVGINTDSPTETLDVDGTFRVRVADQMTMTELATSDSILVVTSTGVVKRIPSIGIVTQAANTGASGIIPVATDGTIVIGDGTSSNQITLGQQGATSGQFLAWNGTNWVPTTLSVSGVETVTILVDNNDGTFSYTDENDDKIDISKASLTDNTDGTYTFSNGNGSDITFNTNENDGIVGNEVTNATDATLTRSGAGTDTDPYTLDVADGGINTDELADNAVTTDKIVDGTADGQLLQWNGSDWVLVDDSALVITENDGIVGNEVTNATDATLTRSGAGTDADPYTLDVANGGITTDELADNAVTTDKIANKSVTT
ncbi:MAG: hypothetical protein ACK5IC_00605, partial [Moheibacter sp.]